MQKKKFLPGSERSLDSFSLHNFKMNKFHLPSPKFMVLCHWVQTSIATAFFLHSKQSYYGETVLEKTYSYILTYSSCLVSL